MTKNIGVIVIGGTGYGAKEFLRLSETHPEMEIAQVVSHGKPDCSLEDLHPSLFKYAKLKTSGKIELPLLTPYLHKFLILALPSELSAELIHQNIEEIRQKKIHIIDLSGCCRLSNPKTRKAHYPESSIIEETLPLFTYGLTEINSEKIKSAMHVSNPGCYATAAILSLAPLTNLNALSISIDGKSGSSGAGKNLNQSFHHPELHSSSFPYKIGTHRHEPEIQEHLKIKESTSLVFCPHVIPLSRGMLTTSYVTVREEQNTQSLINLFKSFYKDAKFVRIKESPAKIQDVVGSNFCHLSIFSKNKTIVISAAIDNLVKGMAGQAIQNLNLIAGLPEEVGLDMPGFGIN